jgi:glycosyltransferase involved in cell wall biosynthesis
MRILFAFENSLPNTQADAEVFAATANALARRAAGSWLHIPLLNARNRDEVARLVGLPVVRAWAPLRPAALRHLCCGLTIALRKEFHAADLVYTRNLWMAALALLFGQKVAFDHYRPWPAQIPPLQHWIHRLICRRRFLVNICHSEYTRNIYRELGIPEEKLVCIHNGYEPQRLEARLPLAAAKRRIGVAADQTTVVYTGRINHKKGLDLVLAAAGELPDVQFILVGAERDGPLERRARAVPNIRLVPWQPPEALATYIFAADILLIPPSRAPLAEFGSTVLPLKLYLYLAAGRPILAGNTPDVAEILRHGDNAWLCDPDCLDALLAGIRTLRDDRALAARLAARSLQDSRGYTWEARAGAIAALLASRLGTPSVERGHWGRAQTRAWAAQSWRWLRHLLRTRSWVLPAEEPGAR